MHQPNARSGTVSAIYQLEMADGGPVTVTPPCENSSARRRNH
jgi:hypothetical protein